MKSTRHVYVELAMVSWQAELLAAAMLTSEDKEVVGMGAAFKRHLDSTDATLVTNFEHTTPQVDLEQNMCDEPGCENQMDEDDERAPEGMCTPCRDTFLATHVFKPGHGPGTGWIKGDPTCSDS